MRRDRDWTIPFLVVAMVLVWAFTWLLTPALDCVTLPEGGMRCRETKR